MTMNPTRPRSLTDDQLAVLGQLEGDLGAAVDRLLADRGIPVRVNTITLVPLEAVPASEPIGPDPSTGPPTKMPPPGGVYQCWQEVVGGPWICVCGAPEVLSSGG